MKILTILSLLFFFATAYSQDYTASVGGSYYVDSLITATRDTVDVSFLYPSKFDHYLITAWSDSTDTLVVSAQIADASAFVQRAVIGLTEKTLTTARATYMITGTTPIDFLVIGGPQIPKFRFTSPGIGNAIHFILSGQRGIPIY